MKKIAETASMFGVVFILMGAGAVDCASLKYEDDIGQLNSAQANSMESLVKVNGRVCKDLHGKVGLCALRTESDQSVVYYFNARPYSYNLDIKCSAPIQANYNVDIEEGKTHRYTIAASKFAAVRSFTCIGEVHPHDRPNELSATWQTRVVVVDDAYQPRDTIYWKDGHIVLGKYAKYSTVCDEGKCEDYHKVTVVEASASAKATSESEMMRYNYKGY